jgi:hypothetical protein
MLFLDYLIAVASHWIAAAGILATLLLTLAPLVSPGAARLADRIKGSRAVVLGVGLVLFVYADFSVYDEDQRAISTLKQTTMAGDLAALPKSPDGLRSGQPWNNGGVLSIVP